MTFKTKRRLKKEYMPKYYKNISLWGLIGMFAYLIVGLYVCIAIGLIFEENPVTYITLLAYLLILLAIAVIIIVLMTRAQKRLIVQRTEEIESEFTDLNFDEVTAALTEKHVITEYGFVANLGEYAGVLVVPFKEATVAVFSANIYTKVCSAVKVSDLSGNIIAEYTLSNELFNFICKKGVNLNFVGDSRLLVDDKAQFVKVHIKGNGKTATWGILFGAVGMMISNETDNVNLSKRVVLSILDREMKEE